MNVGTAQIDITPRKGVALSGFAARTQPATGVLDPLYAKALYLAAGGERLLWIHTDLVGLEEPFVLTFREWAARRLELAPHRVMLSATHTHSGPATIHLTEAGEYDAAYVAHLQERLKEAAFTATHHTEPCEVVHAEGRLELAVDRRGGPSAHHDPRVGAIGWRRRTGEFAAVQVNYAMHSVALGSSNRCISADVPGQCAQALSKRLPGSPLVLATNGACGNLNPPAEDVPFALVEEWGTQIAQAVADKLRHAGPLPHPVLSVRQRTVPLATECLDAAGIAASARMALSNHQALQQWGDCFRRAVHEWQRSMTEAACSGRAPQNQIIELQAVRLGPIVIIGAGAELFSKFTELVQAQCFAKVYTIGYANGLSGYIPATAAYAEGGYEVELAHLFYNRFRLQRGCLEQLAEHAVLLVREVLE
ncbi:MAG: hypothetical protein AB1486_29820 [Planctomycetota bacterium]